jgi:hypothetical protein
VMAGIKDAKSRSTRNSQAGPSLSIADAGPSGFLVFGTLVVDS